MGCGKTIGTVDIGTAGQRHPDLDAIVAVKVLNPHQGIDDRTIARFKREGKKTARLEHPNIARLLDGGQDGARVWEPRR